MGRLGPVLLLLCTALLAGEPERYAVRVTACDGETSTLRQVFGERTWTLARPLDEGTFHELVVRDGEAAGVEPLRARFLGRPGALRECRVRAAYLVPKGARPRADWQPRLRACMTEVLAFWERALCETVAFRPDGAPVLLEGRLTVAEYRQAEAGFWGAACGDAERGLPPKRSEGDTWNVTVVFAEATDTGGGGSAAAFAGDHGIALITGEVLPFLYLPDEARPEEVDDPLNRGRVPWDWGWGTVAHEFGHTIGLPHPTPLDGSVMGGGWLRGLRQSRLAELQARLMLEPAANAGYLTRWQLSEPGAGWAIPADLPDAWKPAESDRPFVDLNALLGAHGDAHAFARTWIRMPAAATRRLFVGSDDSVRVWLNGKVIHDRPVHRGWSLDAEQVDAPFREGPNELVVACGNGVGGWGFSVRLAGPADWTASPAPPR